MENVDNHELEFKCEKCNYLTNQKVNYEKHLKTEKHTMGKQKTRSDKKENKCNICNHTFSSQHTLKEHNLNIHTNKKEKEKEYKFYCKECNIGKTYETCYKRHINSKKHKRMIMT